VAGVVAQEVFRQQDADDIVLAFADHRKARVARVDHFGQKHVRRVVDVDDIELRARNHDVAGLQLGDLQHAFDHGERVGVHQIALVG
jgi:hypothetical protein